MPDYIGRRTTTAPAVWFEFADHGEGSVPLAKINEIAKKLFSEVPQDRLMVESHYVGQGMNRVAIWEAK